MEGTNCTILEELTKMQSAGISTQTAIDNIAKHYRILLNTILRFSVEAAWIVNEEYRNNAPTLGRERADAENEEVLKLKLTNAELNEQLVIFEQENEQQRKKLALFVGEEASSSVPAEYT